MFKKLKDKIQLLEAVENADLVAVKYCVEEKNIRINFLQKDDSGRQQSPFLLALRNGEIEIARYLITKAAVLNATNDDGATPIYIIAQGGKMKGLQFLLEQGADKDKAAYNSLTPLIVAAPLIV